MVTAKFGPSLYHLSNLIFGIGCMNNDGPLSDSEVYDIIIDKWKALPDLPTPRYLDICDS